jgi:biopolymer transport protein ExbD
MLEQASPLKRTQLGSLLGSTSKIRPAGGGHRRTMFASLMLTSLVDAFSILVIFLIMNHSANQETVNLSDRVKLPTARESQTIMAGVQVRIEGSNYFIEDKPVTIDRLIVELKKLNQTVEEAKKEGLIIVADRNLDYADLSPVILAGSQSGFTKFKFAVVRKD